MALVLLGACIADGGAWLWGTSRITAGLPDFAREAAAYGWHVEWRVAGRAGWPTDATVELTDVSATRPLGGTVLRWRAPRVFVSLRSLDPKGLSLVVAGEQSFEFAGRAMTLTAASESLRVPLDGADPIRLQVRDGMLAGPGEARTTVGAVEARFDGAAVDARLSAIALAPPLPAPFDAAGELAVRATIAPPLPFAPSPAQSAALWQAAGGRVELDAVDVRWGPTHIGGRGGFGLDGALQPAGRLELAVDGALPLLDGIGRAGLVAPGPLSAVRAVASLLALGAAGGPIQLPVVVQDRTAVVARFPVLRLPELRWDDR